LCILDQGFSFSKRLVKLISNRYFLYNKKELTGLTKPASSFSINNENLLPRSSEIATFPVLAPGKSGYEIIQTQ